VCVLSPFTSASNNSAILTHPNRLNVAGRTVKSVREDLEDLHKRFGGSTALLRVDGKAVYYLYDSYRYVDGRMDGWMDGWMDGCWGMVCL